MSRKGVEHGYGSLYVIPLQQTAHTCSHWLTLLSVMNYLRSLFFGPTIYPNGFPGGSAVRIHLPMREKWVQSLGQEDPLEKGMATRSSTLAWEIPGTEELGGLQSPGSQASDTT